MNLLDVCRMLAREPFNIVEPERQLQLEHWWIAHVLFCATDKYGRVEVVPKTTAKVATLADQWRAIGRVRGWPRWYTEERIAEDAAQREATREAARLAHAGPKQITWVSQ